MIYEYRTRFFFQLRVDRLKDRGYVERGDWAVTDEAVTATLFNPCADCDEVTVVYRKRDRETDYLSRFFFDRKVRRLRERGFGELPQQETDSEVTAVFIDPDTDERETLIYKKTWGAKAKIWARGT